MKNQVSNEHKIFITNLPIRLEKKWLENFIFLNGGSVKPKSIVQVPDYKSIVIVEFNTINDVKRVKSDLNYIKFDHCPIRMVEFKKFDKNACILINSLPLSVEVSQLHDLFSNFGEVLTCEIPLTDNRSNGYGYIQFIKFEDAENAVNYLQGGRIENQVIHLSFIPSDRNPFTLEFEFIQKFENLDGNSNSKFISKDDFMKFRMTQLNLENMTQKIWRILSQILYYRNDLAVIINPFFENLKNENLNKTKYIPFLKTFSKSQLEVLYQDGIITETKFSLIISSIEEQNNQKNPSSTNLSNSSMNDNDNTNIEEIILGDKINELQELIQKEDIKTFNTIIRSFK